MEPWSLDPAHDLKLRGLQKFCSPQRESGLVDSVARIAWWSSLRLTFAVWNRLHIEGRELLPATPPFVVVANHASHLDALLLSTALPMRWRNRVFPIAARDVFFNRTGRAALAATFLNALPISRDRYGAQELLAIRRRMLDDATILVIFPEGTRSRTGEMGSFKAGIGMLVAGTDVPVVPCHLAGAFLALPPRCRWLRPRRLTIRFGQPLDVSQESDDRKGWVTVARNLEQAVRQLASN